MSASGGSVSVGGVLEAGRRLFSPLRFIGSASQLAGPVLVVALGLALLIVPRLAAYHGNPSGFVQFGHHFAPETHPPHSAIIGSPIGYDGQFYWIQARDPLVLHPSTLADIDAAGRGYNLQRVAYPALAALLAVGQVGALPWTLLAVNVIAVLALTAVVAAYARHRGRSVWWALAIALTPGIVMGTLRDLSDPLATAAMLGGLICYERGRRGWAAALLTLGVLAREPMIVAVVAVGIDILAGLWRDRSAPHDRRRAASAWPVVIIPVVLFVGWQLYTKNLTVPLAPSGTVAAHASAAPAARAPAGSDALQLPPLNDFSIEIHRTLKIDPVPARIWDLAYIALVLAGMATAVALLRRGLKAATVTAVLTGVVLAVIFFGDQWGISRYGAPLFGALLLAGLGNALHGPPRMCAAAAALTVFVPFVIPGG